MKISGGPDFDPRTDQIDLAAYDVMQKTIVAAFLHLPDKPDKPAGVATKRLLHTSDRRVRL